MPNIKSIINGQDKKALNKNNKEPTKPCNCRIGADCPLRGSCRIKSVIYQPKVTTADQTETYLGLTEGEFKTRCNNHKSSFNNAANPATQSRANKVGL